MLQRIVVEQKKALFILPYVSIVMEKTKDLQQKFSDFGIAVQAYYAASGGSTLPPDVNIGVCTIEKVGFWSGH